jgi:hypothetical protein
MIKFRKLKSFLTLNITSDAFLKVENTSEKDTAQHYQR